MDQINQLPSFDAAFSNLYSSSLGLADQERQFDTSEQQPTYRGMPVQAAESFPIHNSRSDVYQNEVDHSNSLKEYNIESLTNFDSENASGTDFPEIPQSILDECVPYESDNEPVNDAFLLTPSTPFQQLILRDEPAISEQTPANHTRSVFQLPLTNLAAAPSNLEHLRPVAIVDPLYMHQNPSDNQSTSSGKIIDDNTPFFDRERERYHEKVQDPEKRKLRNQRERERRADPEKRKLRNQRERERRADPEKRKLINQRKRERLTDPEKRKLINKRERERYHEKVQDPEKRKLKNQRQRERLADPEKRKLRNQRQRERLADPEKRKLRNQRERERRADPEKRKLRNQRERERRADPEKRKLINQRKRERYHEKVQDPEKRKLINQRKRQRYHEKVQDPEKRKLRNQRQRERYHEKVQDPEKRKLINQRQRERYHEKVQDPEKRKLRNQHERERRADPEKRKLRNQRQQALPAISPSGDISQLSYITEATPTSSTN